jgi:hypothetical protein
MGLFGSVGHFLSSAAKVAGRAVTAPVKLAQKATGAIGTELHKLPVVGPGIAGVFVIATTPLLPFEFAAAVVSGDRVDRAALGLLKTHLEAVHDVAPYAQVVVQFVPGVGQGISAAIGAGLALAEGRPIDQALKDALLSAVPGGIVSRTALALGDAALQGRPLDGLVNALPLSPSERAALAEGLKAAKDIASGKPVAQAVAARAEALVKAGLAELPPDARKALQIGMAIGQGQFLQAAGAAGVSTPQALATLESEGRKVATPAVEALRAQASRRGVDVGLGIMRRSGVTPAMLGAVRGKLSSADAHGFDLALAAKIGQATAPLPPPHLSAAGKASYYATAGMRTAGAAQKTQAVLTLSKATDAKAGMLAAATHLEHEKHGAIWRFFHALRLV